MIEFMNLGFKETDLEPVISKQTIDFHYKKHHKAYVDKTNELIFGTDFQNMGLEDIIEATFNDAEHVVLYNNAGQVFNHNMYWKSVGIGEKFDTNMRQEIIDTFGSLEDFREKLVNEGVKVFGSGWIWLVRNKQNKLEIIATKNGDTPLVLGAKPIFNIDVWEHAYYLDHQNLRKKYLEEFVVNILKI